MEEDAVFVMPDQTGSTVMMFTALQDEVTREYVVKREEAPVLAWLVRVDATVSVDEAWMQYDEPVPIILGGLQSPVFCVCNRQAGVWKFPEMVACATEKAALEFGRQLAVEEAQRERRAMEARIVERSRATSAPPKAAS